MTSSVHDPTQDQSMARPAAHAKPVQAAAQSPWVVRLDLPAGPHGAQILKAATAAYLARTVETPDGQVDEILQILQQRIAAGSGDRHSLAYGVDPATSRLLVTLPGEEPLAIPLPGPVEDRPAPPREFSLGMGLALARALVDEVTYTPRLGQNRWRLVKELPGATGVTPATVRLALPAGLRYLNVLGAVVEALLAPVDGLAEPQETIAGVQLAAQEIAANIVEHAHVQPGEAIPVTLMLEANRLVVETEDPGRRVFDPAAIPDPLAASRPLGGALLKGSALFFISATIVNGGNYVFNLILGRQLGPAAFADLSLIVTLFLMVSFITAGFQQTAAKFAAVFAANDDLGRLAGLRSWLGRRAWIAGATALLIFGAGAPFWQRFFHTESPWPFLLLGIGLPVYFAQGVDRGILQGQTRFGLLAVSYQAEMWVRLAVAIVLVAVGWGVGGATVGITVSLFATWLVARRSGQGLEKSAPFRESDRRALLAFAGPVVVAEMSLILINNSDVLMVKRFFEAEAAGHYAALALVGRMVFFATWSVVITMFPLVAQRQERGEEHGSLLWISLGMVAGVAGAIIAATLLMPGFIVQVLFGPAYLAIAPLLWLYAVATALYALANVFINYRLSLGSGYGTTLALIAGVAQVVGLWLFHASLQQVVLVQIGIMGTLLAILAVWEAVHRLRQRAAAAAA